MLDQLQASDAWRHVHLVSDLHLSANDPPTAAAWHRYLQNDDADALIVLGDYFDLWVGDDLLDATTVNAADQTAISFWQMCAEQLRMAAQRKPIFWMVGNRDFLIGPVFAQHTGVQLLNDPCVLHWGSDRWLLSHGDQWCTDDSDYLSFRQTVRSTAWQSSFLSQPLAQRLEQGRAMRAQSQAHQEQLAHYSDVDTDTVRQAAEQTHATGVIHGHTHQGRTFALTPTTTRHVLSDWDAVATPPRMDLLRLTPEGATRVQL